MKKVSIITVNYHQPEITVDFLNSVLANTFTCDVQVILVDNGAEINQESKYQAVYPNLTYIQSTENLGFAGGNNLGVKAATGEFLLFLNNDTEISANLIDVLVEELNRNQSIGLLSPLILYYDDPSTIQYAGFTEMNYITCRNKGIGSMERDLGQYDNDSRETGYCHGAAMMCRSADLKTVGLMDERYFLYYEELDWCEKFRSSGKKIWFTGRTRIFHKESMSVGKESIIKTFFMTRNRMLFIRRNTGLLTTIAFSCYYVLIACSRQVLAYLVKGRIDLITYVFKGVFWNLTHGKDSFKLGFKLKNS
jgi:GT2 family glycosyltransferase